MAHRTAWTYAFAFLAALEASTAIAQLIGPDVIVGDIAEGPTGIDRYGRVGDITAYAFKTVSCNVGDENLSWVGTTNQHPVIAQNMFRLKDGRFEQIGQAWLKHGFCAVDGWLCGDCVVGTSCDMLGVGCSDPYSAQLNGTQVILGPKSEVNAATGEFPYPFCQGGWCSSPDTDVTTRRLQVHDADLDPDLNPGALYFFESQYVTPDDAAAGNQNNNASYRRVTVTETNPNVFDITAVDTTQRAKPAILAWADTDPTVTNVIVDVPGDGRFILAAKATDLGGQRWHYEYALYNFNSDRSAGTFTVMLHPTTLVENVGFHDVDYHSGEVYDLTDWSATLAAGVLTWSTDDFNANPDANALRWGTVYNFRFDANVPPVVDASITIGLFKPGAPGVMNMATVGPTTEPPDCNANGIPDPCDIDCGLPQGECDVPGCGQKADCDGNGVPDECDPDCNQNGSPDACDIGQGFSADCNGNGLPDECEIDENSPAPGGPFFCTSNCDPDCNVNGIPDQCDIDQGSSADCNGNGLPDECEIDENSPAPGGPFFCTSNCDPDCNVNGIPDECELSGNDCNANAVPDECDTDCNANLTPDDCEYPSCPGILPGDMNCDDVVDELDVPLFAAQLVSGADSCQADMNQDGFVNGIDVQAFVDAALGGP